MGSRRSANLSAMNMTNGQVAEQALRQRRYASLFAQAMTEPDERKRQQALAELRALVQQHRRRTTS